MTLRTRPSPCVLFTGETWGSALHAARSLDAKGVPVFIATAGTGARVFGRSRHCTSAVDLPGDGELLCLALRNWVVAQLGRDESVVVLPLSDRLLDVLNRHRDLFNEQFRLGIPRREVTEALIDKGTSLQLAEEAGLQVPRWVVVGPGSDPAAAAELQLPVILRPTSWATTGEDYFKFIVARSRADLTTAITRAVGRGASLIAQEYLEVSDDQVEFAILWKGSECDMFVACTGRKRRQSAPGGGVMAWGTTEDLPDVHERALRFTETAGFDGLGGVEFIRQDETLWFIEFNPRLEAIHFLATAAGVDTVVLAYDELANDRRPPAPPAQRAAAAWIGSVWLERLRTQPGDWRLAALDRTRFGRHEHRVKAVWSLRDPRPGAALLSVLTRQALTRKRPLDEMTT